MSVDSDQNVDTEIMNTYNSIADEDGNLTREAFIENFSLFCDDPSSDERSLDEISTSQMKLNKESSNLAASLFKMVDINSKGVITMEQLKQFWMDLRKSSPSTIDTFDNLFNSGHSIDVSTMSEGD